MPTRSVQLKSNSPAEEDEIQNSEPEEVISIDPKWLVILLWSHFQQILEVEEQFTVHTDVFVFPNEDDISGAKCCQNIATDCCD